MGGGVKLDSRGHARRYRYVSANGIVHTRWRPVPKTGVPRPFRKTRAKLGPGYQLEIIATVKIK
jgi:hypothetical protein